MISHGPSLWGLLLAALLGFIECETSEAATRRERERERERPRFRRELQISERNFVTLVRTDTSGIEISVTPDDEDSCILLWS